MISSNIREYYSDCSINDDQIEKDLKNRIKEFCKPCWELKICPYGPLVEDFPLPGIRKEHAKKHFFSSSLKYGRTIFAPTIANYMCIIVI